MCSPEGGGKKRHHEHGNATNGGLAHGGQSQAAPSSQLAGTSFSQTHHAAGRGLSLPQTAVLTSVCALGSPALAFSRTSSKGVSTSPFAGPLTWENKQMDCHQAGPCHLSEEGRGRQEQTSAPGQERDSRCREKAPGSCFPGSKDHKAARRRFQCLLRARGGRQGTEGGTSNHHRPLS